MSPKDRRPNSDRAQLPSVSESQDSTNPSGSSKAIRNSETASGPAQDHDQQRSGSNSALTEEVSPVQHKVCAESYHDSWQLPHMLVFRLGCGYNACPSAIFSESTATLIVFLFYEIGIIYRIMYMYTLLHCVWNFKPQIVRTWCDGVGFSTVNQKVLTVEQSSGGGACYQ